MSVASYEDDFMGPDGDGSQMSGLADVGNVGPHGLADAGEGLVPQSGDIFRAPDAIDKEYSPELGGEPSILTYGDDFDPAEESVLAPQVNDLFVFEANNNDDEPASQDLNASVAYSADFEDTSPSHSRGRPEEIADRDELLLTTFEGIAETDVDDNQVVPSINLADQFNKSIAYSADFDDELLDPATVEAQVTRETSLAPQNAAVFENQRPLSARSTNAPALDITYPEDLPLGVPSAAYSAEFDDDQQLAVPVQASASPDFTHFPEQVVISAPHSARDVGAGLPLGVPSAAYSADFDEEAPTPARFTAVAPSICLPLSAPSLELDPVRTPEGYGEDFDEPTPVTRATVVASESSHTAAAAAADPIRVPVLAFNVDVKTVADGNSLGPILEPLDQYPSDVEFHPHPADSAPAKGHLVVEAQKPAEQYETTLANADSLPPALCSQFAPLASHDDDPMLEMSHDPAEESVVFQHMLSEPARLSPRIEPVCEHDDAPCGSLHPLTTTASAPGTGTGEPETAEAVAPASGSMTASREVLSALSASAVEAPAAAMSVEQATHLSPEPVAGPYDEDFLESLDLRVCVETEPTSVSAVVVEPTAPRSEVTRGPVQASAPQKISLDMLERYVAPPSKPKAVASLRGAVASTRPTSSLPKLQPKAKLPKPRPSSAAAVVQSVPNRPDQTFLTGVKETPATSKPHRRSPPKRPQSGQPTSPHHKEKGHVRYCHPIRYNVENGWVTLADVCPHRRAFSACTSALCKEAAEKSEWLGMVRTKAKETTELVMAVDRMWRVKLEHALETSVDDLRRQQAREMRLLQKKLEARNLHDGHLQETLSYLKRNGAQSLPGDELYLVTGLTPEHYEFVSKQVAVHKDHGKIYVAAVLDQRRAAHHKALAELRQSIETPVQMLDSMRDTHLQTIDFHLRRVDRTIVYVLDLTVAPSKIDCMRPPSEDAPTMNRVKRAAKQVTEFLRAALAAFAQVCHEIRRVYCTADEAVQRMLAEARSARVQTKEVVARASSPVVVGARPKSRTRSAVERPSSAPATGQPRAALVRRAQSPTGSPSDVDGSAYESDFDELPRVSAETMPRKMSRMSTAASIPEALTGEDWDEQRARSISIGVDEEEEGEGAEIDDAEAGDGIYGDDFVRSASLESLREAQEGEDYDQDEGLEHENGREEGRKSGRDQRLDQGQRGQGPGHGKGPRDGSAKKKKKKIKKPVPSGAKLRESLAVARLEDSKLNRKALLDELITGRGGSSPTHARTRAQSASRAARTTVVEGSSALHDLGAASLTTHRQPCFQCGEYFRGAGRTMPRLSDRGSECWQRAQSAVARAEARMPDYLKIVRLGDEVFDLSKTFLAKLQESAQRVVDGDPTFCSWTCVKKWALGSCPVQHRYQTEMLINMAAGGSVD